MRLQLDARARRWVKRLPVVNLYSAAELALMAVLAAQCARLVWTVVTPVGPIGDWRPAGVVTPASPLATLTGFDPFFRLSGPAEAAGPAVVTSLQLKLFGTRTDDATGRGSAIVAGADGLQKSVSVGEEVAPGVRLAAVAFDHVTFDRGGVEEDLFLDQSTQVAPVQPGAAAASPAGAPLLAPTPATPAGATLTQLRRDIGFIPRVDGGRVSGLVLRAQGPGDTFRLAGLRDGDVLTAVAGRPVTGADVFDRIGRDFAGGGNVPITVERDGQTVRLAIVMAPR